MTTYVVVDNEVHNGEEYKKYLELITPTVDQYNGKYVIRAGEIFSLTRPGGPIAWW